MKRISKNYNLKKMNSNKEDLLIQSFHALGMRKEAAMVAFTQLKTDRQAEAMFAWIEKHHKKNPSEEEIIQVAERISELVP